MGTNDPVPEDPRRMIDARGLLAREALRFALPCFGCSILVTYTTIWILYQRNPPTFWEALVGSLVFASVLTSVFTWNRIARIHGAVFPQHQAIINKEAVRFTRKVATVAVPVALFIALALWRSGEYRWAFWIPLPVLGVSLLAAAGVGFLQGRRLVRRMQTAAKFKAVGSLAEDKWYEEATSGAAVGGEYTPGTKKD